jgi:hypothetical protein
MSSSILDTIKKMVGVDPSYEVFDTDIIVHINSTFSTLHQLGVGPSTPFYISDKTATWSQFTGSNLAIESVKSYIYAKVKLAFDPPATSFAIEALNKMCSEFEWRLNVQSEEITP